MREKQKRVRRTLKLIFPTLVSRRVLNIADSPPPRSHNCLEGRQHFGLKSHVKIFFSCFAKVTGLVHKKSNKWAIAGLQLHNW